MGGGFEIISKKNVSSDANERNSEYSVVFTTSTTWNDFGDAAPLTCLLKFLWAIVYYDVANL